MGGTGPKAYRLAVMSGEHQASSQQLQSSSNKQAVPGTPQIQRAAKLSTIRRQGQWSSHVASGRGEGGRLEDEGDQKVRYRTERMALRVVPKSERPYNFIVVASALTTPIHIFHQTRVCGAFIMCWSKYAISRTMKATLDRRSPRDVVK
jgi:hypothetical protein